MMRELLIGVVLLVLAGAAAVGGTALWVKRAMNSPHEHGKANDYITIEKGTAPAAVTISCSRISEARLAGCRVRCASTSAASALRTSCCDKLDIPDVPIAS